MKNLNHWNATRCQRDQHERAKTDSNQKILKQIFTMGKMKTMLLLKYPHHFLAVEAYIAKTVEWNEDFCWKAFRSKFADLAYDVWSFQSQSIPCSTGSCTEIRDLKCHLAKDVWVVPGYRVYHIDASAIVVSVPQSILLLCFCVAFTLQQVLKDFNSNVSFPFCRKKGE